jgi:hypothetical protein
VDELITLFAGENRLIGLAPTPPSHAQWQQMIEAAW